MNLPQPSAIANDLPPLLRAGFVLASAQPLPIDTDTQGTFDVTWASADISRLLCESTWSLPASPPAGANLPEQSDLTVEWNDASRACRFTVKVKPPATPVTQFDVSLAVTSSLPRTAPALPIQLVLRSMSVRVADYRNDVGFMDLTYSTPLTISQPRAPTYPLSVTYQIRERDATRRSVVRGSIQRPALIWCEGGSPSPVDVTAEVSRTGDSPSLRATFTIPSSLAASLTPGTRRQCVLTGKAVFGLNAGSPREIDLPQHSFEIVVPAAEAAR
jgi:hypothetical protein